MTRPRQTIPPSFDDEDPNTAAVKAAVRRACAGETAPPELRSRVEQALAYEGLLNQKAAGASDESARRTSPSFWRRPLGFGMAAAAAVTIGAGIAAFQMSRPAASPGPLAQQALADGPAGTTAITVALPAGLGEQLVRSHNACVRLHTPDHYLFTRAPKDNYTAIAQGMSAALNHPVIAAPMGADWDFQGAGICPVGKLKSAHLKFANGDAVVSVYSLPASSNPACPEHQGCEGVVKGEPVAGFVEGGAFYCVVGSTGGQTPVDLEQVRAIRDRLRSGVLAGASWDSNLAMLTR
jgi:hypothetical protein